MAISIKHLQWITVLSFVCLCVRLTVCQAPPTQNNNLSANNECSVCKPKWISTLEKFSFLLVGGIMDKVCNVAVGVNNKFVSTCDYHQSYQRCGSDKARIKSCCCPMKNLSKVAACKSLENAEYACVPDKISHDWLKIFQKTYQTAASKGSLVF